MQIVSLNPSWYRLIDPEWIDALDATPFLARCRAGKATRSELHAYVRQQFYYSRHFTRFLCALLVNITEDQDRLALMQNLFEEMGFGAFGSIPHSAIYRSMMASMNVRATDDVENVATSRLVETMLDCCTNSNPMIGLAAIGLGAEAIVPHVYSQILVGFDAIGEDSAHLEFFRIHVEGDDDHAITMRTIIEREVARDSFQRTAVRTAAKKVIEARGRFFDALVSSAPRSDANTTNNGGRHAGLQL